VSRVYGFDRGQPLDRYYIDVFLDKYRADIQGHVLEVADPGYTRRFGGDRVTKSDVLHAIEGNPEATIVGDLTTGEQIPERTFDCFILTQTLPFIYDVKAAIAHSYRALKPGGVLLATLPGICGVCRYEMKTWGDYWRFTDLSTRLLFEEVFPAGSITVETYGNLLAAVGFLYGLAADELDPHELGFVDPEFQFLISVRAVA
jgi:SAM-dependent methyltransferase